MFDSWNGALNYPPMLLERSSLILAAGVFIDDFVERYKAITTGTAIDLHTPGEVQHEPAGVTASRPDNFQF